MYRDQRRLGVKKIFESYGRADLNRVLCQTFSVVKKHDKSNVQLLAQLSVKSQITSC